MSVWQPIETAPGYDAEDQRKVLVKYRRKTDGEIEYELRLPDGDWWRSERAKGRLSHLLGWIRPQDIPSPTEERGNCPASAVSADSNGTTPAPSATGSSEGGK